MFRIGPMISVSVMVLLVGWSLLWLFARYEAGRSFEGWMAAEREQGRLWSCPNRQIGGFPLSIELRCDHPTFADAQNPDALHGGMAGLLARTHLYFPTNVMIDLVGPANLQEKTTASDLALSWSSVHVSLRGDMPGDLDRGQFEADGVTVAAAGTAPARIGHVELGFRPVPQLSPGPRDADVVLKISDARVPAADATFGTDAPIDVNATATIGKLPNSSPNLPLLLEAWRHAGGDVEFKAFQFTKGDFVAKGDGHFEIDDEHRLDGRLNTHFSGLEPIALRMGLPIAAVKVGGLLSGLLGSKSGNKDVGPAELSLPLVARGGRVSIGPVKTQLTLNPIY